MTSKTDRMMLEENKALKRRLCQNEKDYSDLTAKYAKVESELAELKSGQTDHFKSKRLLA